MTRESDDDGGPGVLLRNEPVQARSTARLAALLDAAAAVVDEIGYERLTTALVAERAGSSIGTVYRYFPDRIAVLQQLASRSLARFETEGLRRLSAVEAPSRWEVVDALAGYWVDAYRDEPGFRSLRFGDVLDLHPRPGPTTSVGHVAGLVGTLLAERGEVPDDAQLPFHLDVSLVLLDAVLARAFAFDRRGDDALVAEAVDVSRGYLERVWGDLPGA
jgi:AcrR family transcriptional regulator